MCRKSSPAAPLWAVELLLKPAYFHIDRYGDNEYANSALERFCCTCACLERYRIIFFALNKEGKNYE
jgi:hypothetical protein